MLNCFNHFVGLSRQGERFQERERKKGITLSVSSSLFVNVVYLNFNKKSYFFFIMDDKLMSSSVRSSSEFGFDVRKSEFLSSVGVKRRRIRVIQAL